MRGLFIRIRFLLKKYKRSLIISVLTAVLIFTLPPILIYLNETKKIYKTIDSVEHYKVGIVFGAGVNANGTPSDMLADRLDTAAKLYEEGKIEKILVSGDNRFDHYNEPEVMYKYLTETKGVPNENIVRDFAGRRTYDTCVRAKEIWGLEKALLITQGYHLSRALFTCNGLGLQSEGFSATLHYYIGEEQYKFREFLALNKAVFDLYVSAPEYVSGEKESDFE